MNIKRGGEEEFMNVWIVLLILGLFLVLLGLIRIGGSVEYSAQGVAVRIRLGCFWISVFPRPKSQKSDSASKSKKSKKKPKPKSSPKSVSEPEPKPGGPLTLLRQYLPLVGEAAGTLKQKIRIDRLTITYTAGASNAAAAALAFGRAWAVFGMLWPVFEQNFTVKEHQFHTAVDFQAGHSTVYLYLAFSARLGGLAHFGIRFAWKFFKVYRSGKSPATKRNEAI